MSHSQKNFYQTFYSVRRDDMNKRTVGSRYEHIAAAYLIQQGYQIVERNYRVRQGEIDLVAREGGYLVFVEVKYRADSRQGMPAEAVDARKQRKLRQVASVYLYRNGLSEETPCRFDVVAILGEEISLIRNAF